MLGSTSLVPPVGRRRRRYRSLLRKIVKSGQGAARCVGGNARLFEPRPSLCFGTVVASLRRPALACGELVEPGTRLRHTAS